MNLLKVKKFKKIKYVLNYNDIFLLVKPYGDFIDFQSFLFKLKIYSYKFALKQFKLFFKNKKILNCFNANLSILIFFNLNILINFFKNFKMLDSFLPLIFFIKNRYLSFNYLLNLLEFNKFNNITPLDNLVFLTINGLKFLVLLNYSLNTFFIKKIKYILHDNY